MPETFGFEQLDAKAPAVQPAVSRAIEELHKQHLDLQNYAIKVFREGDLLSVAFTDRHAKNENVRGSPGKVPAFEVEFDAATLDFKKALFVR